MLDGDGKARWHHPVLALGHVEIADSNGNGEADIIYSNSNNATGRTDFTTLDSTGNVSYTVHVNTKSYEFAMIKWPNTKAQSNILLTEQGKIRLIDRKGKTVLQLDAPGCRAYGEVKAITVRFNKDEPAYLAVKKTLHPDISVLYVYAANGNLVFQKTQVIEGVLTPTLAIVPDSHTGAENLLTGEYASKFKTQVLEYSLTR